LYTYVENNPLRYVDRTGNAKEDSGIGTGGGLGPMVASEGGSAIVGEATEAAVGIEFEALESEVAKISERLLSEDAELAESYFAAEMKSNVQTVGNAVRAVGEAEQNFVYRVIRADESPFEGLIAKNPSRAMTVDGHVTSGSRKIMDHSLFQQPRILT
jgi:hypothetical protein